MKRTLFTFITYILIGCWTLSAQGIDFQKLSLEEALAKASIEKKLVFIDFYTTWCAPCKTMTKLIFPLPEVGEVYNKEFVNIKLDAEKEGLKAAKKYNVQSYPTLLFLDSQGNVVFKETGLRPVNDFIELGKNAVSAHRSELSLQRLQEEFPKRQNDASFLKIYYTKMIEYGQSPIEGINAWLKVQKEIDEDDEDMMEFLFKYKNYIVAGSKGEAILQANFDEYMDIATKKEEDELERFKVQILQNTRDLAYQTQNPDLWLTFMEGFNKLPEKFKKRGNPVEYKMTYAALLKDDQTFKILTKKYIDSLISQKSITEITETDTKEYERRAKSLENSNSPEVTRILQAYKNGMGAGSIVEDIHQKRKHTLLVWIQIQSTKTLKIGLHMAIN